MTTSRRAAHLFIFSVFALSACAGHFSNGREYYPGTSEDRVFRSENLDITIERISCAEDDVFVDLRVENNSNDERVFDPAELELNIPATGTKMFQQAPKVADVPGYGAATTFRAPATIPPRGVLLGVLVYPQALAGARVDSVHLQYRGVVLRFPKRQG